MVTGGRRLRSRRALQPTRFPAASNQCSFSAFAITRSLSPGSATALPDTRTTMREPAAAQ